MFSGLNLGKPGDWINLESRLLTVPDTSFVGGLWVIKADIFEKVNKIDFGEPYLVPEHDTYRILA